MSEVVISVRSDLERIIADLKKIQEQAGRVGTELGKSTEGIGKSVKEQGTGIGNFLKSLQDLGRRTADQLRGDFKTLFSMEALKGGLNLGKQFENLVKGTINVADTVRKLAPIFGMAESAFASFQSKLIKGLGSIGLGADEANQALLGLSRTQVRGEANLIEYAKTSGMLASIGREKGSEGKISEGIADALRSQGKDQNDMKAVSEMVNAVRHTMNATGQSATGALGMMSGSFGEMSNESKHAMTAAGLGRIAAVGTEAGSIEHLAAASMSGSFHDSNIIKGAMGFNGLVGPNGVNFDVLDKMKGVVNRLPGDKVAALGTAGFDEKSAHEVLNLMDREAAAKKKQNEYGKEGGTLETQYEGGRGLGETASGAANKTMAVVAEPFAKLTEKATELLHSATKTTAGAAAVTVGSGFAAAVLTSGGLSGIGKALFGTAKAAGVAKLAEAATGKETIPVFVVNFPDNGLGGIGTGSSSKGSGVLGKLGQATIIIGAASIAFAAGEELGEKFGKPIINALGGDAEATGSAKGLNKGEQWIVGALELLGVKSAKSEAKAQAEAAEQSMELQKKIVEILKKNGVSAEATADALKKLADNRNNKGHSIPKHKSGGGSSNTHGTP